MSLYGHAPREFSHANAWIHLKSANGQFWMVFGMHDEPILNYHFSLQNAHEWTHGHMNFFHAMQCLIWTI